MITCVCGYKHDSVFENGYHRTVEGDEDFIEIDGKFTREFGDYHKYQEDVRLVACPKCGTVRIRNTW